MALAGRFSKVFCNSLDDACEWRSGWRNGQHIGFDGPRELELSHFCGYETRVPSAWNLPAGVSRSVRAARRPGRFVREIDHGSTTRRPVRELSRAASRIAEQPGDVVGRGIPRGFVVGEELASEPGHAARVFAVHGERLFDHDVDAARRAGFDDGEMLEDRIEGGPALPGCGPLRAARAAANA